MNCVCMLPFFINKNEALFESEMKMAHDCLKSLAYSQDLKLVIYNQGSLTNQELNEYLQNFDLDYDIIGDEINVGITMARYRSLQYIYQKYCAVNYIAEIHVDMIFSPNWHKPLIDCLESSEEPLISPRILSLKNNTYEFFDNAESVSSLPDTVEEVMALLQNSAKDGIIEGFVHPVIHKVSILKNIPVYDVGFLTGKQNFEDDSLLLGYSYYLGTAKRWKPKCCLHSCVFHKVVGQRSQLPNIREEWQRNFQGLFTQYGAYGLKELSRIHDNHPFFYAQYRNSVMDRQAYLWQQAKAKQPDETFDIYNSRYILETDEQSKTCLLKIPDGWWSRFYEYHWAACFAQKNDICLDAGCGVIHPFKYFLSATCKEVYACDLDRRILDKEEQLQMLLNYFSAEDIEKAKTRIDNINFTVCSLKSLPYKNDMFDKIYCLSALNDLANKEIQEILAEFYRTLTKTGLLIITIDNPAMKLRFLADCVKQAGFTFVGHLDLTLPNNALYSNINGGLTCFRLLVKK
ncbi:class I SAM-dependent methyltransferase [Sporomusa acidovorans]|nr:methyltransferase domain-containing protein [Sporomusa acidovorans]